MKKGILIVGHGSKISKVNDDFEQLIKTLKNNTNEDVRGAHLTLAKPSLEDVVANMYQDGFREITLIPYFLSNGTHVVEHIPEIMKNLEKEFSNLYLSLEDTLHFDSLVIKAMEKKITSNL